LVRMSSSKDKYVVVVNDDGVPQNFQCFVTESSKVKMSGAEFNGMMECLMYLKRNPITSKSGSLYVLGNPACDKEWYVGMMDRPAAEKMVLAAGKCDYVIRLASDRKNYVLVLNQGDGTCKHCKIHVDKNSFTLGPKTEKTMQELLDALNGVPISTNDGKGKLFLRKPAGKADYYVGNMPRAEAEEYVKKSGEGAYLIRQNTKGDKYVLVVNSSQKVMNFIITVNSDGKFLFGGLPHDSLEMVIRHLRRTPLMGGAGKPMYVSQPAHTTDAEDMIADASFGFGNFDASGGGCGGGGRSGGKSMFSGGMPMFDSDDDEEIEEYRGMDEIYDSVDGAKGEAFEPYRAVLTREVTGVGKEGAAIFIISLQNDTARAVYQGEQVEVPVSATAREDERKTVAPSTNGGRSGGDDEVEDDNDFGGFDDDGDEDEEDDEVAEAERAKIEEEKRKLAEETARMKAESDARLAEVDATNIEIEQTEEEKAAAAALAEQQRKLEEELAGFEADGDESE